MPAATRWRPLLLVAFLASATLLAFSCLDRPADRPDRGSAAGARTVELRTSDGIALNGRLWTRDPRRVVIYLHEYGDDQTSWWPTAEDGAPSDPSAMTFDFRGHGASEGDHEDVASTPVDARAALAFAAEQGYQRVVLVGAGMGAAAAMSVAADQPAVGVLGLSAPADFDDLHPVEVVRQLGPRVALIASDGDLSAHDSLAQFRARTPISAARVAMLNGRDHGVEMLTGTRGPEARSALRRLISVLWQP